MGYKERKKKEDPEQSQSAVADSDVNKVDRKEERFCVPGACRWGSGEPRCLGISGKGPSLGRPAGWASPGPHPVTAGVGSRPRAAAPSTPPRSEPPVPFPDPKMQQLERRTSSRFLQSHPERRPPFPPRLQGKGVPPRSSQPKGRTSR